MAPPRKLPSGKWQVRIKDPLTGKYTASNFSRLADAKRFQDETTADKLTGKYVDPRAGKMTLQQFYDGWVALQVWAPTTRKQADIGMARSELGQVALSAITETHGAQWVQRMMKEGLAPSTITQRIKVVSKILRAAVKQKKLAGNPFEDLVLPRIRRPQQAMIIPTIPEVTRILMCADPLMYLAVCLGAFVGLRIGEVAGLQAGDINFSDRTIDITRQVQEGVIRAPKHGSERTVYPPDDLLQLLGWHKAQLSPAKPQWLFPGRDFGKPLSENTLSVYWAKLREEASLPEMPFRSLRHFYASGLIAGGCDVVAVQHALGHTSATITLNTYSHLWPDARDKTRAAAANLMKPAVQDQSDSGGTAKIIQLRDQGE